MLPLESHPIDVLATFSTPSLSPYLTPTTSTLTSPSTVSSTSSPSSTSTSTIGASDFESALIHCFVLIFIGYISGRLELIPETEGKGISNFVSYFSLPAVIFQALATTDLSIINWSFVASIFLSKAILFILVVIITLIVTKPSNTGLAGLYGIFCTQSNDFALGYPLLVSLYHTTRPEFAGYLYVLAPIQLVIINPIGLFLMEIYKQSEPLDTSSTLTVNRRSNLTIFFNVIKGITTNPIIIMTMLGVGWNIFFGCTLPVLISPIFRYLSGAFTATALFLLGLNMVGKLSIFIGTSAILLPLVLVITKIIILPLIIKIVIHYITMGCVTKEVIELNNFGFLYGTFPVAPTVFIFSLQYDLTTTIITTGMVLSTILSAPLMFISAKMIRQSQNVPQQNPYVEDLTQTMYYVGLNLICLILLLFILFLIRKFIDCDSNLVTYKSVTQSNSEININDLLERNDSETDLDDDINSNDNNKKKITYSQANKAIKTLETYAVSSEFDRESVDELSKCFNKIESIFLLKRYKSKDFFVKF